jgi:hypothetical protein
VPTRQGSIQSFLHEGPARPPDRVDADVQSRRHLAVVPARAGVGRVNLQQHTRLEQLTRSVLTMLDQGIEPFALLLTEPNDELASGLLFRGHPETSTQTLERFPPDRTPSRALIGDSDTPPGDDP